MKGKLPRALLLVTSLWLLVSLSGHPRTMAEESRQDTGMVQCLAASRDALMSLEFPAAGGAVTGQYLVSYTAHDSSPLYDSDGTWQYYNEDRSVNQEVQIAGSYSGGIEGSFSNLRVVGTAIAHVDNLQDDRFDRSYRAEMDSPATATWGPGNSLTLTGIQGEFELVSVNASDIPNTEWLDPQGFGFPDPTMICSPMHRAQTLQDISCFITTDPPELGVRDTTFQANITGIGFDPNATLSYGYRIKYGTGPETQVNELYTGPNPTVTWLAPTFQDGYYSVFGYVTDGGHTAYCQTHFTIGTTEPNNPPECLEVRIVPFPPSAGLPVLGVLVSARDVDGDDLDYVFSLERDFELLSDEPRVDYNQDSVNGALLTIPDGLQPGPHSASVSVGDGKQQTVCFLHFVVPDFTGEEGTGECGPVGIMYLDDYEVEMNALAIDAAIEAALAEGGPEYSLVVSHRQRLIDQFGQEGFEQIDALLANMRGVAETCPFLLIVGDWDIVPPGVLPNPTEDGDPLISDDIYGDTDHDGLTVIDIPVARIPDGDSLDLLLT
ncbi:MAG TPA: hypothetical protein ENO24_09290, partial [Chloroflexi bacterium]|nr:hypothetical protein [Chloroflexota bacterium]